MDELFLHLVHVGATWAMVGLIWFVQVVHYPLFANVGHDSFLRYEELHTIRTGWVVGPFMLAEVGTATWIAVTGEHVLGWISFFLVAAIWMMTAFIQVPLHGALNRAWSEASHKRLVASNWGRTVLWSARGPVALALMVSTFELAG
jgi:hypothetical protein